MQLYGHQRGTPTRVALYHHPRAAALTPPEADCNQLRRKLDETGGWWCVKLAWDVLVDEDAAPSLESGKVHMHGLQPRLAPAQVTINFPTQSSLPRESEDNCHMAWKEPGGCPKRTAISKLH